jgi:hypothetical protein
MKKIFYFFLFLIVFFVFFVYTFPATAVASYYLNKYNIGYKSINGNLLELEIEGINYQNFKIDHLTLKPHFTNLKLILDKDNYIQIDISKKIKITLKKVRLEDFQIKPTVSGSFSGNLDIELKKYILADGKSSVFLEEIKPVGLKNIQTKLKFSENKDKTDILAKINSQNINGNFKGYAKIPLNNFYAGVIVGNFNGKLFGSNTNQKIEIKIGNFLKNMGI